MAYITHKIKKGIPYYYAEECQRVNGKPKRIWQKYLGSLPKILSAIEGSKKKPTYAEIFQFGCPAAYLNVVDEFKIVDILNKTFTKRNQGLSIGFYLTLAAINRGIEPSSKRNMWNWFQKTILLKKFPDVTKSALSSQRFWDNMSLVEEDKIQDAWMKLINMILEKEKIDLSCVSYDGTNFYTFIGTFNMRCSIAKRGKNKQGRRDLRQVSYALFCTRKDQIPLYFDVYEGSKHDSKEFGNVIEKFLKIFENKKPDKEGITIVFDKGNNSEENISKFIEDSNYHFVGSVKLCEHKEILISNNDNRFVTSIDPRLEEVKAYRLRKNIYEKDLTVIVTFNNNLYTSQVKTIHNEINKCFDMLNELSSNLNNRRSGIIKKGKKPTIDTVKKKISTILKGQYMKEIIKITVSEYDSVPLITYGIDNENYVEICNTYFGKKIIITDNHDWSTEDIIIAYHSQYIIENAFKDMKDRKIGSWWPMFHWTDQKIMVHGLYCSLSLLFRALIMKKVKDAGILISMNKLHERLSDIREVINVFSNKKDIQAVISKMDELQKKFFAIFEMNKYFIELGGTQEEA